MKRPKQRLSKHDLIQWVYEQDYLYYLETLLESRSGVYNKQCEDLLNEDVYDLIWDEVHYGNEYLDFILYEGEL